MDTKLRQKNKVNPTPPRRKGRKLYANFKPWRRLDLWLTIGLIYVLVNLVGGIYGLNAWSRRRGAIEIHPWSLEHITQRGRAFWFYLKATWRPPATTANHDPKFTHEIHTASLRYKLPAPLIKAVIRVESNFRTALLDQYGAIGLMQVSPSIAQKLDPTLNPFYPADNIALGSMFLRKQYQQHGNWHRALIAYHLAMRKLPPKSSHTIAKNYARRVIRQTKYLRSHQTSF